MSFIVKGIDLPKDGESIRLVITSSGDVIEVWSSGLAKAYHPCQAIQIPKDHGDIIDREDVFTYCQWDEDALNEVTPLLKSED